jgi:hypothetical protein
MPYGHVADANTSWIGWNGLPCGLSWFLSMADLRVAHPAV